MKYVNDFIKNFSTTKFPTFTKSDAHLFLSQYGVSNNYIKRFLNNLINSKHIYRIKRNYYTTHLSPYVAGFAFAPFYYGLGTALNIYNFSEQQSLPTIISASKSMPRTIIFMDKKIFIHRINVNMFFGINTVIFEDFEIPVSDIEKTFLDLIYFRYGVEDYVYRDIFKKIDNKKMNEYLKSYSERIVAKYKALKKHYG